MIFFYLPHSFLIHAASHSNIVDGKYTHKKELFWQPPLNQRSTRHYNTHNPPGGMVKYEHFRVILRLSVLLRLEFAVFSLFSFLCKWRNDVNKENIWDSRWHALPTSVPAGFGVKTEAWTTVSPVSGHKSDHKRTLSSAWLILDPDYSAC